MAVPIAAAGWQTAPAPVRAQVDGLVEVVEALWCYSRSTMGMPPELAAKILAACSAQGVEASEVLDAAAAILAADECAAYLVWEGPGYGQEFVLVDVNVAGTNCLYNVNVRGPLPGHVSAAVVFLDTASTINLAHIPDQRSPYVLAAWSGRHEIIRIFCGKNELGLLQAFQASAVAIANRVKARSG